MLPFESFTPSTISAGIEVWAWIIGEKVDFEVAIMSEITSAWIGTVKHGRGIFSQTLKSVGLYSLLARLLTDSNTPTVKAILSPILSNIARQIGRLSTGLRPMRLVS